ncbi:MAG: DNA primase [Bacteroidales bacterium]|nr:DNA primase [Bacteroidales bacterium]
MIPEETKNRILDAARIEEVVGDFVTLKRRGASFVACCPFHNEKTPSFHVTPSRGIYKCFGCGKAGSSVGFLMDYEHLDYPEALRYLANKYHIEIQEKEETAEDIARKQHRETLFLVNDFAQKFFVENLQSGEGRAIGYAYLRSRGLSDETIARFGLGWSPADRTALAKAAVAAGFKEEYLIEAGLCVKYDDGRLCDRFHDRVTFPIHAVSGRVIGFSCRILVEKENTGKYMNSPETEIYVKSRALYGVYLAKSEISKLDKCYLVEGNVDVVSMHQLGITNLLASCGTALTSEQVRLIKKYTDNVTVMYDGDSAGIKAAVKAIKLILAEDMNVRLVLLPDGEDPDSYSRKHTLEEVRSFLDTHEQDFISFMADRDQTDGDPIKKAALISDISGAISLVSDAMKRTVLAQACADRFGIDQEVIFGHIKAAREKAIEEAAASEDRARRRVEAGLEPVAPYEEAQPTVSQKPLELNDLETNKVLASAEKDLLYFILSYGTMVLDFESDSEYYSGSEEDKPFVADFIRDSIESDGSFFQNDIYRQVYDQYFVMYDEGLEQDEMLRRLLNSEDRNVAFVTAELSVEKYQLTVKALQNSMTTVESWLVKQVPKAILYYAERRFEDMIQKLRAELQGCADADRQIAIMTDLSKFQKAQAKVKVMLGRERKDN